MPAQIDDTPTPIVIRDGTDRIYVVTWGSGSCPNLPTLVRTDGPHKVIVKTRTHLPHGDTACTSDLAPTTSTVQLPSGIKSSAAFAVEVDDVPFSIGPISAAAPHAATADDCTQNALRARYAGWEDSGQTFYGAIMIWNVGSRPCRVAGTAHFAATLTDGSPNRFANLDKGVHPVDVVLSAAMRPYVDGRDTNTYMHADLAAPEFTQVTDCVDLDATERFITPASFTLTIDTLTFTVPNDDPKAMQNKRLSGCNGTVFLEGVIGPIH